MYKKEKGIMGICVRNAFHFTFKHEYLLANNIKKHLVKKKIDWIFEKLVLLFKDQLSSGKNKYVIK